MSFSTFIDNFFLIQAKGPSIDGYWGTEDGLPPPDLPPCGLRNEFCPVDHTCKNQ